MKSRGWAGQYGCCCRSTWRIQRYSSISVYSSVRKRPNVYVVFPVVVQREEQDKNDFLTIHCYDENTVNTRDRRVFHRGDALYTGTYINSPHYLMRIDVEDKEKNQKTRRYTIVISQYEKVRDVSFSITAYCTLPARFKPIDDQKLWRYRMSSIFESVFCIEFSTE